MKRAGKVAETASRDKGNCNYFLHQSKMLLLTMRDRGLIASLAAHVHQNKNVQAKRGVDGAPINSTLSTSTQIVQDT